jgi:hypothetical protein
MSYFFLAELQMLILHGVQREWQKEVDGMEKSIKYVFRIFSGNL